MKFIPLLLVFFVLIGCKEENKTNDQIVSDSSKQDKTFNYKINFPDTVYLNEKNDGEILYNSPLDTLTEEFSNKDQGRYVVFRTLYDSSFSFHKDFYNDSLSEYRIGAIDNRTIPFYDLSFEKTGKFNIYGLVNDLILIEPNTKNNLDKNDIRLIEHDYPVTFKVVVIDSTKRN